MPTQPHPTATAIPERLTCEGVAHRRSHAPPLNGGIAARSNSDMFKAPLFQTEHKPNAKRWDHRISAESKLRKPSPLKGLAVNLATPGIISLGGGLPSSDYFPFESLSVKVPAVGKFSEEETRESGETMLIGKHDRREGKSDYDLAVALNYGLGSGSSQMIRWVTEHTEIVHNPPYRDWGCTMTVGSTSSLEMAFRMFTKPGDYIIAEEFTFSAAVETCHPLGCRFLGIPMDSEGILADTLDSVLSNWDVTARAAPKPHLMYLVPTGQNPTGATQSLARRKAVYKVAQKHDLIIIEDEPYYFLQMQPYTGPGAPPVPPPADHEAFVKTLVPSLLSLDVDGRVVRLDSFSKVLSPGTRCGWVVASAQIIERYQFAAETSVQFPSGLSQVILHRLLDEQWGHSGYLDWLIDLRMQYTKRRDVLMAACEEHLPKEVASWTPPAAGMFHWINLKVEKHPRFGVLSVKEIEDEVFKKAVEEKVLVVPGSFFLADRHAEMGKLFVRTTFAAAEFDSMVEAIRRLGVALRSSFELTQ